MDETWSLLGQFASVFAAVAAAIPFGTAVSDWFKRTVGSRRELKRRLSKMVVGVTSDHVRSLFGVPIMQNKLHGIEDCTDYVFMSDHAWIVTREQNGAVVAWSITVTDRRFAMDLRDLTFGLVSGKLGHSTFAEVVEQPAGQYEERGAANYTYAERTYFGRPSAYQSFVFAYNNEGIGTFNVSGQDVVASYPFVPIGTHRGDLEMLDEVRRSTMVNTFLSCGLDDAFLAGGAATWPVVHHDFVIPLRASPRLRKKWLKKRTT
ncbi:ETEC_3214 domain-containing protein [Arthrobacter bambusae]|uniref:ETEC_3214 domain-containing protein n=1 Tax=Arthrobacter bambusae TaxID=1338426 RepID=UPI00277F4801|nr:ETEC_3214 domain-containing protein [Arthrobacter bambusae]MDQ0032247.1 hypothetical protein [Arthrobacter bambusae]MDQ0100364.1 hypothetical protein [Arthrobacter bambusae]